MMRQTITNQRENLLNLLVILLLVLSFVPQVSAQIRPQQIAVVVNTQDANSQLIADYYRNIRGIPRKNIIEISLPADKVAIGENKFNQIFQKVKQQTPDEVQYYALAWSKPFKVACMSMTSAFAFGFDRKYCATGCKATRKSEYYNSDSLLPNDDLNIRPAMMLSGSSLQQVYKMIDRGVAADKSNPQATAYLMSTTDKNRNVRSRTYRAVQDLLADSINIVQVDGDILQNKNDVMFYFTGLKWVEKIASNKFLPGAIADHLTSSGGSLYGSKQMSLLRWLDAGATASYGTVAEPCAFTQKFPNPGIVIERYLKGESLIEAYWKSVAWPGQGLFVGELMSSPYADAYKQPLVDRINVDN